MCNLRIDILKQEADEIKAKNKLIIKETSENNQVVQHLNQR